MSEATAIAESRERFVRETATHQIKILQDDGLYRHLRFMRPDTSMYYFDLVTWPGHLVVTGDCGSYMFSRTTDMFEFFAPHGARGGFEDERWGINPYYWGEKLRGASHGRDQARSYSKDAYRARVLEWFEQECDDLDVDDEEMVDTVFLLRLAVDEQLLLDPYAGDLDHEDGARERLNDFEWTPPAGSRPIRISDTWEWDLREYDWSYLWCCWAIVWGIDQYRAAVPAEVAA